MSIADPAPATPTNPSTEVTIWLEGEAVDGYATKPYAVVHLQPHHLAGDVARYAAERMQIAGLFSLYRDGEILADNDPVGPFVSGHRKLTIR